MIVPGGAIVMAVGEGCVAAEVVRNRRQETGGRRQEARSDPSSLRSPVFCLLFGI